MSKNHLQLNFICICYFSLLISILSPCPTLARQAALSGTVSSGIDFWTREYKNFSSQTQQTETDKQYWFVNPALSYISQSKTNTIYLQYQPSFKYNTVSDQTNLDHSALFDSNFALAKTWSFSVKDQFILTDNPTQATENDTESSLTQEPVSADTDNDELSQDQGRKRFWNNIAKLETSYLYAKNSQITLGYHYNALRYVEINNTVDTSAIDHDKHDLFSSGEHRLNQRWKQTFSLHYIKGTYFDRFNPETSINENENFTQHQLNTQLHFTPDKRRQWSLKYSMEDTRHNNEQNKNTFINNIGGAWRFSFSPLDNCSVSGGLSHADTEGQETTWDYNAALKLSKKFQHGKLDILFSKQYDTQNFTGSDNNGLVDDYNARIQYSHKISPQLSLSVNGVYNYQKNLFSQTEQQQNENILSSPQNENDKNITNYRKRHEIGTQVKYKIHKKLIASIQYIYSNQTGDIDDDSYIDHQLVLQFTWAGNLNRW